MDLQPKRLVSNGVVTKAQLWRQNLVSDVPGTSTCHLPRSFHFHTMQPTGLEGVFQVRINALCRLTNYFIILQKHPESHALKNAFSSELRVTKRKKYEVQVIWSINLRWYSTCQGKEQNLRPWSHCWLDSHTSAVSIYHYTAEKYIWRN